MPHKDKEVAKRYYREYREKNKERKQEYERNYYLTHKEHINKRGREDYIVNKQAYLDRASKRYLIRKDEIVAYQLERQKNPELKRKILDCRILWNARRRAIVMDYYSDGKFECACCGERTYDFLTVDHINGGGYKHKLETKGHIASWLIDNNFPPGYAVLCYNCNCAKGKLGRCPHEKNRSKKLLDPKP